MFDDYSFRPWYHRVEEWLGVPQLTGRAAIFVVGERPIDRLFVDAAATHAR